ncbi:mitochondrial cardiolipin hydrolase isoform X1 [Ceratina calcarata]|uniref:Mitochondrial cardiolipin hydrolase n=1 Tax=Ceratina calcarata TaxID=156304 RepID=A0AAJ7J4V8_9HYME|nr:mitochondrial cardiolipin hydrolase isoform X1 [Ceratina calcarata]
MRVNKILMGGVMVLVSEIVWYFSKKLYSRMIRNRDVRELERNIAEVMFFSKESKSCRVHVSGDLSCDRDTCPVRYMRKLESCINQAGRSLDVCIYMLTCQSLVKAIVNAHKRGVLVRVILDAHAAENRSSDVAAFHSNGIPVKLERIDGMMHHKFLIVDREIIITGSMNWTMAAFFGNWENLIVSNQNWLVKPFVDEFDRLWHSSPNSPDFVPKIPKFTVFDR